MVGRNVEPRGLPIYKKQFLFGGFIFPTHPSWAAEVGHARFAPQEASVFRVTLKKSGLQGVCGAIFGFHPSGQRSRLAILWRGERKQDRSYESDSEHRLVLGKDYQGRSFTSRGSR